MGYPLPAIHAREICQKSVCIVLDIAWTAITSISAKIGDREDRTYAQKRVGLGAIFGSYI
jgi:hypothetical protein